ncbi:VOC family protein [Aureimonas altamirensis]|uniref:2-oxoadipate dioxygenase/decarboxylase HglS n=1 Tax=Aureimonas altamirensis TaxID=370622 RepID=UPI0020368F92|nr:VOC family protein [Aureimonas altamirensis]MCM2504389.1 VOC family protein [Aureimonas altamirensis]
MTSRDFMPADEIRADFSRAMSEMYRHEVPQYGTLMQLVAEVNSNALKADADLATRLARAGELDRLSDERHGAIRLGTAAELFHIGRLFAVMGMHPVGYYDLAVAGIPVHSTAFRPIGDAALSKNPFRVFTSLLRLDLIHDDALRTKAAAILEKRRIFTPEALELASMHEAQGGLTQGQAERFVTQALETFRWHSEATVDPATYAELAAAHRLIADIVCFKGPHINHLTPRTLDIDAVQAAMPARGIVPKAVIEGPPPRRCPILLRQTSFKALEEDILFPQADGHAAGRHTARFGEIEQRGAALTPKGRTLYDALLADVRQAGSTGTAGSGASGYMAVLIDRLRAFPDDWQQMRSEGLAFFRYSPTENGRAAARAGRTGDDIETLLAAGHAVCDPLVYEDFLPVSAAGIFQSNLGTDARSDVAANGSKASFEKALGRSVLDEMDLYREMEMQSLQSTLGALSACTAA